MKLRKYRIVRDSYSGYECQIWRIWFPFWIQMSGKHFNINTHESIEDAKNFIENHKNPIVWED